MHFIFIKLYVFHSTFYHYFVGLVKINHTFACLDNSLRGMLSTICLDPTMLSHSCVLSFRSLYKINIIFLVLITSHGNVAHNWLKFIVLPSFPWWIDGDGRITGADAVNFFSLSKLSRPDLKQVPLLSSGSHDCVQCDKYMYIYIWCLMYTYIHANTYLHGYIPYIHIPWVHDTGTRVPYESMSVSYGPKDSRCQGLCHYHVPRICS